MQSPTGEFIEAGTIPLEQTAVYGDTKTPEAVGEKAKIEDFGEKLPPARRAMAAKLNEDLTDEAIESQPLSKIWPLKENEAIEDTFAAAVASVMRENIPAKPRKGYKLNSWVAKVKMLRDLAAKVVDGRVSKDRFNAELDKYSGLKSLASKIKLLEQIDREQWGRIGDVSEAPDALRYEGGKPIRVPQAFVKIDGKQHWLQESGDINDHVDAIKALLAGDAPDVRMQFEIRQEQSGSKKVFINKKGDKEYRRLMEFDTVETARKAMKDQYDDLVSAWDGVKARDNINERDLRAEENRPRAGKDHRKGKDISAEEFQDTFGFVGGEFGKWVSQGENAQERQFFVNSAYDAFMDLTDILGIPPKAISLEGTLGIAFGSRGSGWASAHFEPSNLVINLTKPRGAGALAHEWFHAMDNYFARKRGGEVPMTLGAKAQDEYRNNNFITHKTTPMMVRKDGSGTPVTKERLDAWRKSSGIGGYLAEDKWIQDPNHKEGVRAEVEERFENLVNVLNQSPMLNRSKKLERSGDYWSRTLERAARSFENYIMTRMMEQGYHNDFLANVKDSETVGKNNDRYPYLLPEEIAPVAEAFDNLFNTIQTKETDRGTAMFSRVVPWFSPLTLAIEGAPDRVFSTGLQVKAWLMSNTGKTGVKQDELQWSGILDYLELRGKDKVTKAEIDDYLAGNGVVVNTVRKGDKDTGPRFFEYLESLGYTEESASALGPEDRERITQQYYDEHPVPTGTKFDGYWEDSYKGGIPGTYRETLVTLPRREAKQQKKDTTGWTVEVTKDNEFTGQRDVTVRDASGSWRGMRSGFRGTDAEAIAQFATNLAKAATIEAERAINFKSGHWDEPNILVHLRTDEVIGADGKRYLRVGEIQSDWGQKGKKEGFLVKYKAEDIVTITEKDDPAASQPDLFWYFKVPGNVLQIPKSKHPTEAAARAYIVAEKKVSGGVAPAPFVTDTKYWVALGIKQAIRQAIESGVDGIIFGTGEQSANLYDLSKQVDGLDVEPYGIEDGVQQYRVTAMKDKAKAIDKIVGEPELDNLVGKDIAKEVIAGKTHFEGDERRAAQAGRGKSWRSDFPGAKRGEEF